MILDSVNRLSDYVNLHPLFSEASKFVNNLNFDDLQLGKTEIINDDLFAIISNSSLRIDSEAKLETHNKYIDIQIPVSKIEKFGWSSRVGLQKPIGIYESSKDILFYEDIPQTYIEVKPLNFIIFYPEDAHAPCIGEGEILKIVIKVKVKPSVLMK